MSKDIVVTSFLIAQSEASVFNFSVSMDHEMRHLINLFTLYKPSIEHSIELLVIQFYLKSTFLLLNATANDMAAKTEKS